MKNSKDITKTVAIIIVLAIILTVFFIFNKKTQDNVKVKESEVSQGMVLPEEDTTCNGQLVDPKTIDQKQMDLIGRLSIKGDIYTAYRGKCEADCKFYIAKGDGFEKILSLDYKVPNGKITKDKMEDNKLEFTIEPKNPPREEEGTSGAVIIYIQAIIWKKDITGLFITLTTVPPGEGLPASVYFAIGSKNDNLELLWCNNTHSMIGRFETSVQEFVEFNKDTETTKITFNFTTWDDAGKEVTTNYVLKWDDMQNKLILLK